MLLFRGGTKDMVQDSQIQGPGTEVASVAIRIPQLELCDAEATLGVGNLTSEKLKKTGSFLDNFVLQCSGRSVTVLPPT